jgi:ribosomal protein S14
MDNAIYPYALVNCADEVFSNMRASGAATHCSVCTKPFTAARKPKGIARSTHISLDNSVHSYSFVLCRKCHREASLAGSTSHENLFNPAALEAALFMAKPKGTS